MQHYHQKGQNNFITLSLPAPDMSDLNSESTLSKKKKKHH